MAYYRESCTNETILGYLIDGKREDGVRKRKRTLIEKEMKERNNSNKRNKERKQ
jgi:hypothetical protein